MDLYCAGKDEGAMVLAQKTLQVAKEMIGPDRPARPRA